MSEQLIKTNEKYKLNIVTSTTGKTLLSKSDKNMDIRAMEAVKAAIGKAKICNKPIAKYDISAKKAYIEYANGEKIYVE